ncbi:MAG: FAD-dependent oxidoreductase [Treponema sp.]|nr:FAD-dependent oxidoreductase [Treponema sp.]
MNKLYDLIIIGAGPSGLSAAIYAGRAKLKTLLIERSDIGGQIKITSDVVNYPGVLFTSGKELTEKMKQQAESFGVSFVTDEVVEVDFSKDIKEIKTKFNETYQAVGIIIATGARPRKLGFEGEAEFSGRGIAYCATCDGELFSGKDVFVIGGGFAAAEEAIFLTRFARKVTVIVRQSEFSCAKTIADQVLAHEKMDVKFNTEIVYIRGTNLVKEAKFINNKTKETWIHHVKDGDTTFGIFIFVGYEPMSSVFKDHLATNDSGYILANEDMQTNVSGVYVAGDIRPKRLRQLVTATSDGATASTSIEKYIEHKKKELGIQVEKDEAEGGTSFFSEQAATQIRYVMERCESKVQLNAVLAKNNALSDSIKRFLDEFAVITDKVTINVFEEGENPQLQSQIATTLYPVIALMDEHGKYSGVNYHGTPAGHELESFILAIYNVAGPGQSISGELLQRVKNLKPANLKIGVSLSCTMCPDVVQACQRIGVLNDNITAEMVDLQYYPGLRDTFSIMSIPALIINDTDVLFGRKSFEELLDYLEKQ